METSMTNLIRQSDILDIANIVASVVGCGSLGSNLCLSLSNMGIQKLKLFDNDMVSDHNIPNSAIFSEHHIGLSKVTAIEKSCLLKNLTPVFGKREEYANQTLESIVFSAVDSMPTRKQIWNEILRQVDETQKINWYIEGRMGGMFGEVFIVDPYSIDDIEWYETELHEHVVNEPCSARSYFPTSMILACIMADTLRTLTNNSLTNRKKPFSHILYDTANSEIKILKP